MAAHRATPDQSASDAPDLEPFSLRIRDATRFTGLSRSTLYVLIAQGKIEIIKIGRATLIRTASLKAYLSDAGKGQ